MDREGLIRNVSIKCHVMGYCGVGSRLEEIVITLPAGPEVLLHVMSSLLDTVGIICDKNYGNNSSPRATKRKILLINWKVSVKKLGLINCHNMNFQSIIMNIVTIFRCSMAEFSSINERNFCSIYVH